MLATCTRISPGNHTTRGNATQRDTSALPPPPPPPPLHLAPTLASRNTHLASPPTATAQSSTATASRPSSPEHADRPTDRTRRPRVVCVRTCFLAALPSFPPCDKLSADERIAPPNTSRDAIGVSAQRTPAKRATPLRPLSLMQKTPSERQLTMHFSSFRISDRTSFVLFMYTPKNWRERQVSCAKKAGRVLGERRVHQGFFVSFVSPFPRGMIEASDLSSVGRAIPVPWLLLAPGGGLALPSTPIIPPPLACLWLSAFFFALFTLPYRPGASGRN